MKRRKFIYQSSLGVGGFFPVVKNLQAIAASNGPYLTNGIKIGEVTQTSAIVWIRLTSASKRIGKQALIPKVLYLDESTGAWEPVSYFKEKYKQDRPNRSVKVIYPDGYTVSNIEGAVPGSMGETRVVYRKKGNGKWNNSDWVTVDNRSDYSTPVKLENLLPGSDYEIKVEAKRAGQEVPSATVSGKFTTAWQENIAKEVLFMVTTCHEYDHQDDPGGGGFKIYKHMQSLNPQFMVHTGDVLYYDQKAKDLSLAQWHWQRMFALPNCVDFYRQVPCYFMKDDHDTWMNDCYPGSTNKFMGQFTFQQGVQLFRQQVPMSEKPYRTFRWGKDCQVWLVEVREFRASNDIKDGPEKTIWGKEQMDWFKSTLDSSDATFKILISPTPIVGPDRPQKKDNHANSGFAYEGAEIRNLLSNQKNVFIVCGDRHWQYVSKDKATGLMEFSCGPASDEHAGGWPAKNVLPEHQYLNIVGGFLGINIKRDQNNAKVIFTHYGVDGQILFSTSFNNLF